MSLQLTIPPSTSNGHFTITDPESQPGLTPEIERGLIPSGYINRYVVDHDVPCAFCPPHMPHRHGFTARMPDGRIALCGRDCGRKYFGHDVARGLEKALERAEERARRQKLITEATAGIPFIQDQLWKTWVPAAIKAEQAIRALPRFRQEFLQPDMSDGTDYVINRVRVDWIEKPEGGREPVETRTEIGRVRHMSIVWMKTGALSRSYRLCRQVMNGVDETDKRVSEETRFRYRTELLRTLEESITWLQSAQVFLAPENIAQLNRMKNRERVKCSIQDTDEGRVLVVRREAGTETYPLPDLRRLPTHDDLIAPLRGGAIDEEDAA